MNVRKMTLGALALLLVLLTIPVAAIAAPAATDTKIDAVLTTDVSTSMNESDVNKVSYEAMKMFVDMASVQGDKIGVVAYTDQILREKALLKISSAEDKQNLKTFIDQLTRGPYTDIAVGLDEAVKVLESGSEKDHVPMIVLLTDGNNSLNPSKTQDQSDKVLSAAIQKAKDKGYPVYTIGLNADGKLNKDKLQKISDETGGKLFVTSTADKLPQILSEIYASHLKLRVVPLNGFTANGQFQDVKVNIPNGSVLEANISIMSSQPVEVKLIDPASKEQNIPSDKIVYTSSSAYSLIKILNPAQGDWTLKVKGVPQEKIDINLVYNYDLQVVMDPLASKTYKAGDGVSIKAHLESGGQKAADAELYKDAKAALVVTDTDTNKTSEVPLKISDKGIEGAWKVADAHSYELKVKVENTNFSRESRPVKLNAKGGSTAAPAPGGDQGKEGTNWVKTGSWIAGLLVLVIGALFALAYWKKANKGFFGQVVLEIKDEETGERTNPQYKKLNAFKGKVQLHQLLSLAPEFAETKGIVFKPGPGDTLVMYNQSGCTIEKGGRVFDASQGKEVKKNDRIRITLQNVNKSISLEYLK
ncbi:VWA domain-containing protein [Paenibacillus sp. FJAT-26967]|uniref:vWA domain-containing protein n=1 Tax=Paenibacillus sp. FJAT-26967 TaxID=1729690 RepID=UPI000A695526|nr:vWA domain-containing protein [Paenibacillus sp. FJAT-26967]